MKKNAPGGFYFCRPVALLDSGCGLEQEAADIPAISSHTEFNLCDDLISQYYRGEPPDSVTHY